MKFQKIPATPDPKSSLPGDYYVVLWVHIWRISWKALTTWPVPHSVVSRTSNAVRSASNVVCPNQVSRTNWDWKEVKGQCGEVGSMTIHGASTFVTSISPTIPDRGRAEAAPWHPVGSAGTAAGWAGAKPGPTPTAAALPGPGSTDFPSPVPGLRAKLRERQ